MAMDESHPDTIYAATPYGIYKTVDCAEHWIKTEMSGVEINCIKVSRANPGILIASSDSMIYKSEDGGGTWNEIWKSERSIGAIAFDPSDATSIWAGVNVSEWKVYEENLYHSTDGGTQWEPVPFKSGEELKLAEVMDIHFDRSNENVMYVVGSGDTYYSDGGLFVSQDKGESWTNYIPGGCSSNKVVAVTTTPAHGSHAAYVLVNACDIDKQVFRSLDFGDSWEELWTPFDTEQQRYAGHVMEVDQQDSQWLMVSGRDKENDASVFLYESDENKWYIWAGSPHSHPNAILSHPEGNFLGFKHNGVYQNPEASSGWVQKNQGMKDVEIIDLITYPGDPDKLLVAASGNLAKTDDMGLHWSVSGSSYTALAVNHQDTSIIYAGKKSPVSFNSPYHYYKSLNGGSTWQMIELLRSSGMWDYYYSLWIGDILVFPGQPDKILIGVDGGGACGEGLYLTTDGGESWDMKYSTGVSAIAMDPVNNDVVYLGTTALGYVDRSEDGGASWTRISPGGKDSFVGSVWDLAVDKNQQVFAATSDGLYHWEGGEDWSPVEGVPAENIPSIVIDNRPEIPVMYLGTETSGILSSRNGGQSWESFNTGLDPSEITGLKMNDSYPVNLYAGTKDKGVWITELASQASSVPPTFKPEEQLTIYPNPNNGTFSILSGDDRELKGSLQILNLLGEVIHTENDFTVGGKNGHEIVLDHLSAGCYILMFNESRQTITRKIIVESR